MESPGPDVKPARKRLRRWFVGAGLVLGTAAALFLHYQHNFHPVVSDLVFRSAQLGGSDLEMFIRRHHFHTIINLRGKNPGSDWYKEERDVAQRYHLRHFDIPTDSNTPPTPDELSQLVKILAIPDALPLLIHCHSGIDRTSIIAAVCILLLEDSGALERARNQLHWSYGQRPWSTSTRNHVAFLDEYQSWLSRCGCSHSRDRFRQWVTELVARETPASKNVIAALSTR